MNLEEQLHDLIDGHRRRADSSEVGEPEPVSATGEAPDPTEMRQIFRKFRRAMGDLGNPGTVPTKGALRAGWIIASGQVEGYGDEVFHVVMLTNGALHYFSGDLTEEPAELTGKWFLGDSIPELEAKMLDTIARLIVDHNVQWPR